MGGGGLVVVVGMGLRRDMWESQHSEKGWQVTGVSVHTVDSVITHTSDYLCSAKIHRLVSNDLRHRHIPSLKTHTLQ